MGGQREDLQVVSRIAYSNQRFVYIYRYKKGINCQLPLKNSTETSKKKIVPSTLIFPFLRLNSSNFIQCKVSFLGKLCPLGVQIIIRTHRTPIVSANCIISIIIFGIDQIMISLVIGIVCFVKILWVNNHFINTNDTITHPPLCHR